MPSCLKSAMWAPEVIVVDDFSTDNTPKICLEFKNVQYLTNQFIGFGNQKNYAVSKAKNDWILNIDADEEVTSELKHEIQSALLESNPYSAFYVRRKNLWFGKYYTDSYPGPIRLFKKTHGHFRGYVHEKVEIIGKIGQLNRLLLHKPKSFESLREHYDTYAVKYAKFAAMDYLDRGERVTAMNAVWKIIFLPLLVFIREYVLKKRFILGKVGLYTSLCSSICYHKAYINLITYQKDYREK